MRERLQRLGPRFIAQVRLVVLITALSLAYIGQAELVRTGPDQVRGPLVLGLASLLAAWALPELKLHTLEPEVHPGRQGYLGIIRKLWTSEQQRRRAVVGMASVGCMSLTLFLLSRNRLHTFATVAWVSSLVLWVLAFAPHWRLSPPQVDKKQGLLLVSGLLVLGFGLRFYGLDRIPPFVHGDEGEVGLQALEVLAGRQTNIFAPGRWDVPLLNYSFFALTMRLFGADLFGLRMASVIFGLLSTAATYLLARLLFGERVAWLAMFLVTVSHWHIHFSRIAHWFIPFTVLELVAFYFIIRGVRSGKALDFVMSGLATGLGLYLYFAARAVPFIVIAFLVGTSVIHRRLRRRCLMGLTVWGLTLIVAFAPLGLFVVQHWDRFNLRAQEVFVLNRLPPFESSAGPWPGLSFLWEQFKQSVLFFNWGGDHSQQYAFLGPMLDVFTAPLLVLGLAFVTVRWKRLENFLLLLWFWITLVTGSVLTVPSPASQRLIGLVPCLFIVVALVLDRVVALTSQVLGNKGRRVALVLLCLFLVATAYANETAYLRFVEARQGDRPVAEIARFVQTLGDDYKVYFFGAPDLYFDHTTIRFIARGAVGVSVFNPADVVPIREPVDRHAAFIVLADRQDLVPFIQHFYPHGLLEEHRDGQGRLWFTSYRITRKEIEGRQGLWANYYPGSGWLGEPQSTEAPVGPTFDGQAELLPLDYPFSVEWTGTLFVPVQGEYFLGLQAPAEAQLSLEGKRLAKQDEAKPATTEIGVYTWLAQGAHPISVRAVLRDREDVLSLFWIPPQGDRQLVPRHLLSPSSSVHGLLGIYGRGLASSEGRRWHRIDPIIAFRQVPGPSPDRGPFQLTWQGRLYVPVSGRYIFSTFSNGSSQVFIDGIQVVDNTPPTLGLPSSQEGNMDLQAGFHDLTLHYTYEKGWRVLLFYWIVPRNRQTLVPVDNLYPW